MLKSSMHYKYCVYITAVLWEDHHAVTKDYYEEYFSSVRLKKRQVYYRFQSDFPSFSSCDVISLDIREEVYFD